MLRVARMSTLSKTGLVLLLLLAWSVLWASTGIARAESLSGDDDHDFSSPGAVYTLTNAPGGNAVAVFQRAAGGKLTLTGTVSTGGLGTGAGLGSQGPIALSQNGRWVLAVNAASNTISALKVDRSGNLRLIDTVASGGTLPISLTINKNLVYVLNAGGNGNIAGFKLNEGGHLQPLAASTRPLSGNSTGPAQVSFSPNGKLLVVTEKATNKLDTYTVDKDGRAQGPATFTSAGTTPFGFAFAGDNLVVSEAFGGAVNQSAASSYRVSRNGRLEVVSASAPTFQTAACWVGVTPNGKYAYTANAGSSSLTGYRVAEDGKLIPLNADGRTGVIAPGSGPQDVSVSGNGRYLYVIDGRVGKISAFEIQRNGQLVALEDAGGLPVGSVGIAAS